MGIFDKIFSTFARSTYKGICKAMINSYKKMKQQNPKASKRELYALALSLRPSCRRKEPSSYAFIFGQKELTIKKTDKFLDVVRNVIILETAPEYGSNDFMINYFKEVAGVVIEEFQEFKE